eukprot:INCI16917.1.p1 GENE.INCI16917.1~~INCI16917.1.p1  ORF type:complete len:581 (-),score=104.67 INCI16917.1:95-1837(-)
MASSLLRTHRSSSSLSATADSSLFAGMRLRVPIRSDDDDDIGELPTGIGSGLRVGSPTLRLGRPTTAGNRTSPVFRELLGNRGRSSSRGSSASRSPAHRHSMSASHLGRFSLSPQARQTMPGIFRPKTAHNLARALGDPGSSSGHNGSRLEESKPFEHLLALTPRSNAKLVKVQSQVRARNVVRRLPQLKHAYRRGEQRRNKIKAHKNHSAVQIQKIFRMHHTWRNRHRILEQRAMRDAAVELQRHVRGLLCRRGEEREVRKLYTVLWLQSRFRGHRGRRLFLHLLFEKRAEVAAKRAAEEAVRAAANEAAEKLRLARLELERERARRRREEEEEQRRQQERKEFSKRKAAERELVRREAEKAAALKRKAEAEEAARLAAIEAETARLAALAFKHECERAEGLKEKIKAAVEEQELPMEELKTALEEYVSIRADAAPHVKEFQDVIKRLKRMEELTRLVVTLKNKDISEIRSFSKPPASVVIIIRMVYVLLGESAKSLGKWINIAKLLGQKGNRKIQSRIQRFHAHTLEPSFAAAIETKIAKFGASVVEIDKINKSVSLLYAWLQGTIDMVQCVDIIRRI